MIKQIFMVATAHPLASEKAVADAFKKAETELNEAINEGYSLFAHYPVNAHQLTGQMFVMHKADETINTSSLIKFTDIEGQECIVHKDEIKATHGNRGSVAVIQLKNSLTMYFVDHDELKRINDILMVDQHDA